MGGNMILGFDPIDLAVIIVYLIGITAVGLWAARKANDMRSFFMGNRSVSKLFLTMHVFGTITHSDQAVPVVKESYRNGLSGIWTQWVWLLTTPFNWLWIHLLRRTRYVTFADFYAERYGTALGIYYSIWGMIFMMVVIGTMLLAIGRTFEGMTGGAMPFELTIFVTAVAFTIYGASGGISAIIVTNFFQGILEITFSILLLPFVLVAIGGFSGLHGTLPEKSFELVSREGGIDAFFVVMAAVIALMNAPQPHHMQMGGVGKTEFDIRVGSVCGGLIKRLCTIAWMLTGLCAAAYFMKTNPELHAKLSDPNNKSFGDAAFGAICTQFLGTGFLGLMAAAMLASVMCSCDTFMVDGAALFTKNMYKKHMKPDASDRHYMNVARLASVAIVAGGIGFVYIIRDVFDGILIMMNMTAPLGVSFWAAMTWRRANRYGAWASLIVSMSAWLLVKYNQDLHRLLLETMNLDVGLNQIHAMKLDTDAWQMFWIVATGFPVMIIVSLLTKRESKVMLDKFYTVMHTPVGQEHKLREAGIKVEME